MFEEHPEVANEMNHDLRCNWYNNHGPFFPALHFLWFIIGVPCLVTTMLALLSLCGINGWAGCCRTTQIADTYAQSFSAHKVPLITCVGVPQVDVDDDVHRWVSRGAYSAILYGVLLLVLAIYIALHEADFSLVVEAVAAFFMFVSKLVVAICVRVVHRHLSPTSQQVAKHCIIVLTFSKTLTAVCALLLSTIYLILALSDVDANRGGGTRRSLQEDHDDCAAGFFMMRSFLLTLISQSVVGSALASIYANAVHLVGDWQIFHNVVSCWWGILAGCTYGVGVALWLGAAICMFPALDISPLRMLGFFYCGAAVNQVLADYAMVKGNEHIRSYWVRHNTFPPQEQQVLSYWPICGRGRTDCRDGEQND